MDICVVTYRNSAERVAAAARPVDRLYVRDNTHDNIGFAAGANAAARCGDGDVIVFVNPDGTPAPDCFEQLERAMEDPSVVAAEAALGPECPPEQMTPEGELFWLTGACLAVRRAGFEAVGGFDARLFMYCEDLDLSYKLSRVGALRRCPQARYRHDPRDRHREFRALHRNFRNYLVVQRRHSVAQPFQMLRDIKPAVQLRHWRIALARVTGLLDYLVRARRWA